MDPYRVLGIPRTTTKQKAKSKYRELVKKYHPDNLVTGDAVKLKEVYEAWKVLEKALDPPRSVWVHNSLFTIKKEEF